MTNQRAVPLLCKATKNLRRNRSIGIMGALYEDVEKFFGDIFAYYAVFVVRFPVQFMVLPVIISSFLGLGLLNIEYEFKIERLYTPIDGKSVKDREILNHLFPIEPTSHLYPHQQINHNLFSEVIVTCKMDHTITKEQQYIVNNNQFTENRKTDGYVSNDNYIDNVLALEPVNEILALYDAISNITIPYDNGMMTFSDLCVKRNKSCIVNGLGIVIESSKTGCLPEKVIKNEPYRSNDPYNQINEVLANISVSPNGNCVNAQAIKLRFNLQENISQLENIGSIWEEEFSNVIRKFQSNYTHIFYLDSESVNVNIRNSTGKDIKIFMYSVIVMILYATIVGGGRNWVSNHVTLAYAGVFAALLSILASLGLLSMFGMKFVNMSGIMPFIIIGIGADDMFQLMTEWRQTNVRDSIESRMAATMRSAAVSITITSLTDILAFCIGATSPFMSVKNFCACSGVAVLFCYFNQLTFFSGCLVLHAKRVGSSRHCLTCLRTKSREAMENEDANSCSIILCSGHAPQKFSDEGGICRLISRRFYNIYPRFLLHWITKMGVVFLIGIYFCTSIWGLSFLKQGFRFEEKITQDTHLSTYLNKNVELFANSGPVVMFVVTKPVDYHKRAQMDKLKELLSDAQKINEIVSDSTISWLDQFDLYLKANNHTDINTEIHFIQILQSDFLPQHPQFLNDVRINEGLTTIEASRFYVLSKHLNSSEMEANLLINCRDVSNSFPYMTAYSYQFIFYEQYVSVLKDTLLAVGVTMVGLLFVALVFIPHPIAVTCVTISMLSVVLGMMAFMSFWQLELSAITTIQIILCVAFCVDSTVHMSHAFMTATGKNRNERVTVALEKVGIPILNGAFSSFLAISMLAIGDSYIFKTFFKSLIIVIVLTLLHSIVFLPVILSFIGPRRTSKPRVFIPVSPSARCLQDTYRANSIYTPPSKVAPIETTDFSNPPPSRAATIIYKVEFKNTSQTSNLTRSHSLSEIEGQNIAPRMDTDERRVSFAVGGEILTQESMLQAEDEDGSGEFLLSRRISPSCSRPEMEVLLEQNEEHDYDYIQHSSC